MADETTGTAKKILILSANPRDTARLRLDKEVREIQERLKRARYGRQFTVQQATAVRICDLQQELLEHEPHIVHFCGHGENEGLLLENNLDEAVLVPAEGLASLFALCSRHVECVLLNSCHSRGQAEVISQHIPYVIGMKKEVLDDAAVEFAGSFYGALGAGRSIEDAFQFGRNVIQLHDLPDHLTPILLERQATDEAPEKLEQPSVLCKDLPETNPGKRPLTYCLRPQVRHFVDRNEIRAQLRDDLQDEQKVIVVVDGLAGIGKTSLAAKIAEEVEADFTGIYWTKCSGETDLDQLLAELAYFLSEQGDHALSGVVEYPAPAANKISFLINALAEQKYLLVFDDLHELLDKQCQIGNEGLRCLFSELLKRAHQSKTLLVSRMTPLFCRQCACQSKNTLEDIDPQSSLELLQILGVEEEQELLEQACRLTAGHPLAMELLASLAEIMPLEDILEDRTLFFRDTDVVEHLLRHLSSTLTAEERGLLTRLSVLPRPVDWQVICSLSENRQVVGLLKSLIRKALVTFDRKTKLYRQHDLVREFSRSGMSTEERRDCHVRMAAYYEQLEFHSDKPTFEQVQQRLEAHYHTFQAGDVVGAAVLLVPIAEYLRKWGYLERCRALLYESLAALEDLEQTEEHLLLRVDLLVEMGWLERSYEGLDKAVERCRQAEEILQGMPDEGREGKVCHALGKFLYEEAEWDESEKYFERAVALQKSQRNTTELARILCDFCLLYWNTAGESDKIEPISRECIEICERVKDEDSKCRILIKVLGKTFQDQRRWDDALAVYEESLKSRKNDNFLSRSLSLRMMGQVFRQKKDFDAAFEKSKESLILAEKSRDVLAQARALQDIGDIHRDAGNVDKAVSFYEQGIELANQTDDLTGTSEVCYSIGKAYRDAGQLNKAFELFQELLRIRKKQGNIQAATEILNQLGFCYSTRYSEFETALQYYQESLDTKKKLGRLLDIEVELNNIASVYKKQGKLDESLERFRELFIIRNKRKGRSAVALTLNHIGHIYHLKGKSGKALHFFNKGLSLYRKNNRKGGVSTSLSFLGDTYLALGDYKKALSVLQESLELKDSMYSKADPLTSISEVYYRQEKFDMAQEKCEESLAISRQYGGKIQDGVTLHLLSKILLKKGQRDEALQCVQEAVDIFRTSGSRYLPGAEKTMAKMNDQ